MESYQDKQRKLFEKIEAGFKQGQTPSTTVESVKDFLNDKRICLTTVSFAPLDIRRALTEKIINPLKKIDPGQYYFPEDSLHLTIKNVKVAKDPPSFTAEDADRVAETFSRVFPRHRAITFDLQGLLELPVSVMVKAVCDESLRFLINDLDQALGSIGLPDDKKYASSEIFFGNTTVCRYTHSPSPAFLEKVKELKNVRIGKMPVKEVSLIITNAVCYQKKTKIVKRFYLQ
ncbi:MAG: hypothetical protein WCV50_03875 [Patescibacteria group bacterium]|jgi:2'-5' RNA ligase